MRKSSDVHSGRMICIVQEGITNAVGCWFARLFIFEENFEITKCNYELTFVIAPLYL